MPLTFVFFYFPHNLLRMITVEIHFHDRVKSTAASIRLRIYEIPVNYNRDF